MCRKPLVRGWWSIKTSWWHWIVAWFRCVGLSTLPQVSRAVEWSVDGHRAESLGNYRGSVGIFNWKRETLIMQRQQAVVCSSWRTWARGNLETSESGFILKRLPCTVAMLQPYWLAWWWPQLFPASTSIGRHRNDGWCSVNARQPVNSACRSTAFMDSKWTIQGCAHVGVVQVLFFIW